MPKIVKPYLVETPQSKYRLIAENVTFCCKAFANPDIHYYEWFRNHSKLDSHVYPNQTQLFLTNLSKSDSGIYQCKAYSDTGVIMSEVAKLNVKATPNEFCNDALKLKPLQLPDDCVQQNTNSTTYELHECSGVPCRNYTSTGKQNCRDEDNFCCAIKDFQIVTVDCSDYVLELVDAQSCECDVCKVSEMTVLGTAKGQQDGTPVKFGTVYVNGEIKSYTTDQGFFEFSIEPLVSKIILIIKDNIFNEFLPAVRIIELSDGLSDILKVEVKMMRAAEPIKINSSVENMLQAGSSSESNSSNILLSVPANAFYFENGSQFFGIVEARLTFLDPSNTSVFDDMPGEFEYIDEEGNSGGLISLGVFNLYFEDISGNPLIMNKVIDAYMPQDVDESGTSGDFKLWTLSPQTGIWELEKDSGEITRKRRSHGNAYAWVGALADVSKQTWYNYDKVYKLANSKP
ncbi:cartilage intermediate layer protein 1-like [Ruditapes philippinarum]|uniref:cartilage intermediate layer protein 1-like n=1 Tax=Ruditapes philippinarum TaxID=129788 RepID=UPI00295AEB8A|nr:cartilage intermediate layer protein 1-like [Ruditapes philippinarum]